MKFVCFTKILTHFTLKNAIFDVFWTFSISKMASTQKITGSGTLNCRCQWNKIKKYWCRSRSGGQQICRCTGTVPNFRSMEIGNGAGKGHCIGPSSIASIRNRVRFDSLDSICLNENFFDSIRPTLVAGSGVHCSIRVDFGPSGVRTVQHWGWWGCTPPPPLGKNLGIFPLGGSRVSKVQCTKSCFDA